MERLLGAAWPAVRGAGWWGLIAALAWSAVCSGLGIYQKWTDPRTRAAQYIAQHVPAGASIGTATDHGDTWQHHGWHYPAIDFHRYRDIYFVDRPDFVVVTEFELQAMRAALQSPKLLPGGRWDPRYQGEWYLGEPPPPEVFAFYEDLFAGRTYRLLASFESPVNMPFDGACRAVYLYELPGQRGGK